MQANTLITNILKRLDELDATAPIHWTRAEILVFVNDAISEFNLIAWEFQGAETISIDSTHNIYNVPTAMIAPISIRDESYLRRYLLDDLDKEARWENSDENRMQAKAWAPVGLNLLAIWPRPMTTKSIYIEGIIEHTPVTDTADDLPIRPEYEAAIEDYCVERATFKEGGQELGQAGALYEYFLDSVQLAAGRNVIRMYPKYSRANISDESLRGQVDKGNGN